MNTKIARAELVKGDRVLLCRRYKSIREKAWPSSTFSASPALKSQISLQSCGGGRRATFHSALRVLGTG